MEIIRWIASVGVDPKPFNQRLFNPCCNLKNSMKIVNICGRIPELEKVYNSDIHNWSKKYMK